MRNTRILGAVFVLGFLAAASRPLSASAPDWLRSAAQQPTKTYASDVNAVVLLSETENTVKDNGDTVTRERRVIRVLLPEGRNEAFHGVPFDPETQRRHISARPLRGIEGFLFQSPGRG